MQLRHTRSHLAILPLETGLAFARVSVDTVNALSLVIARHLPWDFAFVDVGFAVLSFKPVVAFAHVLIDAVDALAAVAAGHLLRDCALVDVLLAVLASVAGVALALIPTTTSCAALPTLRAVFALTSRVGRAL